MGLLLAHHPDSLVTLLIGHGALPSSFARAISFFRFCVTLLVFILASNLTSYPRSSNLHDITNMAASRWTVHAWRHVLLAALFWALATAKPSVPVAYCAKINTASMPASEFAACLFASFWSSARAVLLTSLSPCRRQQRLPVRWSLLSVLPE